MSMNFLSAKNAVSMANLIKYISFCRFVISTIICIPAVTYAQEMQLEQVLQKVIDHYPSIKTAAIQVERARQQSKIVNSQLGWQFGAQAGVSRDVNIFTSPSDRIDVSGDLSRQLSNGSILSLQAGVHHVDEESVSSPSLANPSTSSIIDLRYRKPLRKGVNNPAFTEGLAAAEADADNSQAELALLYDQLGEQVIDLYAEAATVQARIANSEEALIRARRLKRYIKKRAVLGLSEDKDILQVEAQQSSLNAELKNLTTTWEMQRISLNRLMGFPWDTELQTSYDEIFDIGVEDTDKLFQRLTDYNPQMKQLDARLLLADSALRSQRDQRQDMLDLVMFVGSRTQHGDSAITNLDESELVGGVRLEFSQSIDKNGLDAALYQAQLARSAVLQDKRQLQEDLHYDLLSLLAELTANQESIHAYRLSVASERRKLKDARERYYSGRVDTDQIIQFEDQLSLAEFRLELQRIDHMRRYSRLELLLGNTWQIVNKAAFVNFDVEDSLLPLRNMQQ